MRNKKIKIIKKELPHLKTKNKRHKKLSSKHFTHTALESVQFMMKVIRDKTSEPNTPTTRDPAPLGVINESGHSSVLLYGQLMEGILLRVKLYNC